MNITFLAWLIKRHTFENTDLAISLAYDKIRGMDNIQLLQEFEIYQTEEGVS